jgi:hypothetical protein
VQCGVFNGTDAAAIVSYTDFASHPKKTLYLLDTFVGAPEAQWNHVKLENSKNSAEKLYREVGDRYSSVVDRFTNYPNVRIIQGNVPDTLDQIDSRSVAALFLDMDWAAPETAAMEFFWERIVRGGMIFSNGYGRPRDSASADEQKLAMDAFAEKVGLPVLSLPTGAGLILKT